MVEQCTCLLQMYLLGPFSILDLIKYTLHTYFSYFVNFYQFLANFSQFCLDLQAFHLNFTDFNQNFSQIDASN